MKELGIQARIQRKRKFFGHHFYNHKRFQARLNNLSLVQYQAQVAYLHEGVR